MWTEKCYSQRVTLSQIVIWQNDSILVFQPFLTGCGRDIGNLIYSHLFFSKVRQYPCTFLPLHMPKTDAVIMIWSLKVPRVVASSWPPPLRTLTSVLLVRVSKHLMQPNNLVMGCCLFDTPTIFLCIAGLSFK